MILIKIKRLITIILLMFYPVFLLATGPSYIFSEMRPVSVNKKGEVLCRTRFVKNGMGGHWFDKIEYGLCILTDNQIIEFNTKILDPAIIAPVNKKPDKAMKEVSEEEYASLLQHWDWVFKTGFNFEKLSNQQQRICKKYGFRENNAEQYNVDTIYKIMDLEKSRNVDLKTQKQLALKNVRSTSYGHSKKVKLSYDFGNIIIFHNEYDDSPESVGADFDYQTIFNEENIGYEYYKISGVLFLSK